MTLTLILTQSLMRELACAQPETFLKQNAWHLAALRGHAGTSFEDDVTVLSVARG